MFFRELRKKLPPKILLSLCISLIALLVVFLVGAERTSNKVGCRIIGAFLHYFMLTTFLWMAVEAENLHHMFVTVFKRRSQAKFIGLASLIAWGKYLSLTLVCASCLHTVWKFLLCFGFYGNMAEPWRKTFEKFITMVDVKSGSCYMKPNCQIPKVVSQKSFFVTCCSNKRHH